MLATTNANAAMAPASQVDKSLRNADATHIFCGKIPGEGVTACEARETVPFRDAVSCAARELFVAWLLQNTPAHSRCKAFVELKSRREIIGAALIFS